MPIVTFRKAERRGTHIILAAYGESGCGKTYSLIKLGRGLVGPNGKLGMLDTETGRGLIYAKVAGGYEYAELTPPFTPERYAEAVDDAEQAGIDALIIDSGSHVWEGMGGILEMADSQVSQSGKSLEGLVKWARPKARYKKYVQRLLTSRMHLLISLRAKERFVQGRNPQTLKEEIISAGYIPIQDKRFIFETTVQLFLPVHEDRKKLGVPVVQKCPEDLYGAFPEGEHIGEETGSRIAEWVNGGAPVDHVFERLKRNAEEIAGGGTKAFRAFWRQTIDKNARDRLRPCLDNLKSIADAADREQAEREREGTTPVNAFETAGREPHISIVERAHQAAERGSAALWDLWDTLSRAEREEVDGLIGTTHSPGDLLALAMEADRDLAEETKDPFEERDDPLSAEAAQ
jgi:hypothetical protein